MTLAPRFAVQTARSVARFTAHLLGVVPGGFESGVGRGFERLRDLVVTLGARFGPDQGRARDVRWSQDDPIHRGAGNQDDGQDQ